MKLLLCLWILEIIRKNGKSASTSKKRPELDTFVIDDASDDEVVLIPTASLFSCNRLGEEVLKLKLMKNCKMLKRWLK